MPTYTLRVPKGGLHDERSYLVETGGGNRWNILEPADLSEHERELVARMLQLHGLTGEPWAGGFPEETRYPAGVADATDATLVRVEPPFEHEEGVVY